MSNKVDKWSQFLSTIQDGLRGYEPNSLIAELIRVILKNRYEGTILVDKEGRTAFIRGAPYIRWALSFGPFREGQLCGNPL